MTNLDSIFKSKDITLPTKVHLVKAMVFPVVMYGQEAPWLNFCAHLRLFHSRWAEGMLLCKACET